jgi:hypothetical protein
MCRSGLLRTKKYVKATTVGCQVAWKVWRERACGGRGTVGAVVAG